MDKFINNKYMDAFGEHIHMKYKLFIYWTLMHASATGMYSPCNINWMQTPHKNKLVGTLNLKTYTAYILSFIHITQHLGTYSVITYQFQS